MKKLGIIGSGDLGQLIAHHAAAAGYQATAFFDDFKEKDSKVNGIKVAGGIDAVMTAFAAGEIEELMIGIGYKHFNSRKEIFASFAGKIPMANVIHPSVYVDPSCKIGSGVFILPGCVLDRNVVLKDNVLLNTGCVIAHDSEVGLHSFLSPGVTVAGYVKIGECCNIGINTTLIDNIMIADHVQTGGGTVVIKDLSQPGLYVGNPAKFIR
ncbi:MAG: acetyltransferase [Bacteroidia bacterium]